MSMNLQETVKDFPKEPGVYFFKRGSDVLYVGKATSLRDRVRSYFTQDLMETRGPLLVKMLEEADTVTFEETETVLEALILESNLIKKLRPPYNTRDKDDKSFNYVVITDEDYPRVFTLRGRELQSVYDADEFKYMFGPYTSGGALQEALKIIRKIFPFRGKKDPVKKKKWYSPLRSQIGLVPDFDKIGRKEYLRLIRNIKLFFEGKKSKLIKTLEKEMNEHAKAHEFEKAQMLKRQIFALHHINDISLIKSEDTLKDTRGDYVRIEAYDIAHISGKEMVGVMTVMENGYIQKNEYRKFKIRGIEASNDTGALKQVLERRFAHPEWRYPNLIVVDGGKAQINTAERFLDEIGARIPVVSVVKDEKHKPREILGDEKSRYTYEKDILLINSEAHRFAINYHKLLRQKKMRT